MTEPPAPARHFLKHAGVICFVAFALRLLWIFCVHNDPYNKDGGWYADCAKNLAAGLGYQHNGVATAYFPVGYPAFLAVVDFVFGSNPRTFEIANGFLSVATCVLLIYVTRKLYDSRTALWAGWLFALHPNQIFFNSTILSDVLFAPLMLAAVALTIAPDWAENSGLRRRILTGVVVGCAALVRPAALLLPFVFWLHWKLGWKRSAKQSSFLALGALAGIGLVLLPWTVRNARLMGAPILVSTNGGINLWIAQNSDTYTDPPHEIMDWTLPGHAPQDEVEAERIAYHEAFQTWKAHPQNTLTRWARRTVRYFYGDIDALLIDSDSPSVQSPGQILAVTDQLKISTGRTVKIGLYVLSEGYYLVLMVTAAIGCWRQRRTLSPPAKLLPLLFIAWWLAHTLIFFSAARFRMPMMPLVMVFSACFFARLKFGEGVR